MLSPRRRRLGALRIQSELLREHECQLSHATIHKVLKGHVAVRFISSIPVISGVRATIAFIGRKQELRPLGKRIVRIGDITRHSAVTGRSRHQHST